MIKIVCLLIIISTTRLDAAVTIATNHSFLIGKGRATLAAIGLGGRSLDMINLKSALEACVVRSYDPLPVAFALMDEAKRKTFVDNGFARIVSNIYRAVKAIDREHDKDYAHGFLELAVESDKLDLDLFYRHTYWLSVVDLVMPSYYKSKHQILFSDLTDDHKLHFYEQNDTGPITEEAAKFGVREEFYRFFSVKKINKDLVNKGILEDFDDTVKAIMANYSFSPEEEKIFEHLVESLKSYSDKNKQRQRLTEGDGFSNSDTADRRDALTFILAKDLDKSLVRHDATLSKFATGDFVQGKKPLRIRSLSRLYSLVEKFRNDKEVYHELRWQYLQIYWHSLNLSKKKSAPDADFMEDYLAADGSHQAQLVDDFDLYLEDGEGLLTDEQIRDLRSPPRVGGQGSYSVRDHPRFDQIKRHSYFERIVDVFVDERLKNSNSSYAAAREYIIKRSSTVLGLKAKEIQAYIYEGRISQSSIVELQTRLANLPLTIEQSEALERIAQTLSKGVDTASLTMATIKLIEKAIKIANRVYNENDNQLALFRIIKIFSELKQEVTAGRIAAETFRKASEVLEDLKKQVSDDDERVLNQLLQVL